MKSVVSGIGSHCLYLLHLWEAFLLTFFCGFSLYLNDVLCPIYLHLFIVLDEVLILKFFCLVLHILLGFSDICYILPIFVILSLQILLS